MSKVSYEMTEYGRRITPYLLSHSRKRNPEAWKVIDEVIEKIIQESEEKLPLFEPIEVVYKQKRNSGWLIKYLEDAGFGFHHHSNFDIDITVSVFKSRIHTVTRTKRKWRIGPKYTVEVEEKDQCWIADILISCDPDVKTIDVSQKEFGDNFNTVMEVIKRWAPEVDITKINVGHR